MSSDIDRGEELKEIPDIWPLLCAMMNEHLLKDCLENVAGTWTRLHADKKFAEFLAEKYRKGEREYNRGWLSMTKEELFKEIDEELADLLIYKAMITLRFSEIVLIENDSEE
jgi:hypothetical protein